MKSILARYGNMPGNAKLVLDSLCTLLAANLGSVDWSGFGQEEWELLSKIAVAEGVAPMTYYLLHKEPELYHFEAFDQQTDRILAEQESITSVRNAILFKNLKCLLSKLGESKIPVVLLKGADLAQSLYPHIGLRPMGDLDLWVPEERFDEALDLVKAAGYKENIPKASPWFDRQLSHHVHLRSQHFAATQLELHWTLVAASSYRFAVRMDWFWENLEPVKDHSGKSIAAVKNLAFVLNPTANLLFLAAHQMLQHGSRETSLRWLLDLQRLLEQRRDNIDWQGLASQAGEFGWCGALGKALEGMQSCFRTRIPDGLLKNLRAGVGADEARLMMMSTLPTTRTLNAWKEFYSLNWQGRLKLLCMRFFPTREYLQWRYPARPSWFWPICYIHFGFDVAQESWKTLKLLLHKAPKES